MRTASRAVERFRQSVLSAACSGRLTADWREQHPEEASVEHVLEELAATRKRTVRTGEQSVALPLPELPETYVVSRIGAVAEVLEYGTSKRCEASADSGVPVLRMGNIQDGKVDLGDLKYCERDRELDRLLLADADLLFNRTNSPELVGKSAVFHGPEPMSFASYLIRVRFSPQTVHPEFVNYWLNSSWGREWARLTRTDGVSQSNINGTKLSLMALPLPPAEEQRVIVERASRMLAQADALLNRIKAADIRIARGAGAVFAKAFRGGSTSSNGSSEVGKSERAGL